MPGTVADHADGSELQSNFAGIDGIPSPLRAVVEAQSIVDVGDEMYALALGNDQLAIASIADVVEHHHRRGRRLSRRDSVRATRAATTKIGVRTLSIGLTSWRVEQSYLALTVTCCQRI